MTDGADVTNVAWHDWGEAAFDIATRSGKPVLLALVVPWAEECREMDRTTYADPRIAANINDGFVPIRVDADRRPRIRERYNMGGFPSTVFLTPEGEILTGATLLGIDGFQDVLDSVRKRWDSRGTDGGSVPRALRESTPPSGPLDDRIEAHMIEQLLGAYDEEFGGWGSDVKFPMPRTVEFALVRAREQATRTLEAVHTHLLDTYGGGFYRMARNRNWGGARREKLLDENAAIVRAFAHGYRYTGEESYREAAARGVEYLTTTLWTGEGFAASQGGNEGYFRLEPTDREAADAPAVDDTILADRNGIAIDGLLRFVGYTDDERARRYARSAREHVCERLVDEQGRVTHFETADEIGARGLLLDQARVLTGLTTSWEVLGEPGPAIDVADWTLARLQDDGGALRDGVTEGAGLLDRPLYPLDTTVECAAALLDLAALTGESRYETAAREAIEAFAGARDRMGVELAQFATVASRLRTRQVLEVGTQPGSDLHRAALRLADHETVVAPRTKRGSPAGVGDEIGDGRARLVADGTASRRVTSPAELETLLTD